MADPANSVSVNQAAHAQLQHAVATLNAGQTQARAAPIPMAAPTPTTAYQQNIQQWSSSSAATRGATATPSQRTTRASRQPRAGTLGPGTPGPAISPVPAVPSPASHTAQYTMAPPAPALHSSRNPLVPTKQAMYSTYPSRLRTGATLLMQPILVAGPSTAAVSVAVPTTLSAAPPAATRTSRRGAVVSYVERGSEDDEPDAGEIDSGDSDFVASGGVRQSIRAAGGITARTTSKGTGAAGARGAAGSPAPVAKGPGGLDQNYLGLIPPARFTTFKPAVPTKHEYLCVLSSMYGVVMLTRTQRAGAARRACHQALSFGAHPCRVRDGDAPHTRLFCMERARDPHHARRVRARALRGPRPPLAAMGGYNSRADSRTT